VIAWMAGMLYLPRLFVYHCAAETGSVQSETFKVMERRLLRAIINPAMVATWVFGLWLAWLGPDSRYGWFASGWLWAKIILVLALSALHDCGDEDLVGLQVVGGVPAVVTRVVAALDVIAGIVAVPVGEHPRPSG